MKRFSLNKVEVPVVIAVVSLALSGCVRFDIKESLSEASIATSEFIQGDLQLHQTEAQIKAAEERTGELLAAALEQADAIELALVNSPAVQQIMANHWIDASSITVASGIPNPVFEFSRLTTDAELEIERVLAFGLLDLVRLPLQRSNAKRRLHFSQLKLTASLVELVTDVRRAWVAAVVAQQGLQYAEQVFSSAEASAELAASMQAIGNFNAISRARQQAFYADAATGLTAARHNALAAKEQLIRLLGIDQSQSVLLTLPARLPDLPDVPLPAAEVAEIATESRIDVAMAVSAVETVTAQQGLQLLAEVTDAELMLARNTVWLEDKRETVKGYALEIELPIFSGISQVRNKMNARSLAATSALEQVVRSADSHLRESYSAYRSSYDIAKHYRDEVLPLQQLVSEENVLNYNGMIIGIFELLADSRKQITTVQQSIDAAGQFWMADAALRSSMIGNPTSTTIAITASGGDGDGDGDEAGH